MRKPSKPRAVPIAGNAHHAAWLGHALMGLTFALALAGFGAVRLISLLER